MTEEKNQLDETETIKNQEMDTEAAESQAPEIQITTEDVLGKNEQDAQHADAEDFEQIKIKAAKADEYWDRLLRQTAEFDNFRKRAVRERVEAIKYANESLLEKLITVMDHFEAALMAADKADNASIEAFRTGINLIHTQMKSVLTESGLEEISAIDQPFDPNWHEAVSEIESAEVAEGHVMQQLRKGYKLKDRLLRPATVVVAKKPAE